MATIFELLTPENIVSYYTELNKNSQPFVGETLFPAEKQLGTKLDWIKGANNQPVALRPSSYDAKSIRRDREGIEEVSTKMPYFKESMYIDEETRQQLNNFIAANRPELVNTLLDRIYKDNAKLIEASKIAAERMRMEALTTGLVKLGANGQAWEYDYEIPSENKISAETAWSDPKADIIGDIEKVIDTMKAKGVTITRAIMNSSVAKSLRNNEAIKNAVYLFGQGKVAVTTETALNYLSDQTGISFYVYDNVYVDEKKVAHKYVPDNTISFLPDGDLGRTGFGTTPAESDLINGLNANVSIAENGIAVVTRQETDPVNTEVIVSMIALPTFERANEVVIFDTSK